VFAHRRTCGGMPMTLIPESLLTLPIELPKFAVVADLRSTYVWCAWQTAAAMTRPWSPSSDGIEIARKRAVLEAQVVFHHSWVRIALSKWADHERSQGRAMCGVVSARRGPVRLPAGGTCSALHYSPWTTH
jgi:hypothetical protein